MKNKILVVQEDEETRNFLEKILKDKYEVYTAENAVVGIAYAKNRLPDLILLDIPLPHLDGFEACKLIREDEQVSTIPIIILSSLSSIENIKIAFETGADDYVIKPFDVQELLARIQTRLRIVNDKKHASGEIFAGDLYIDSSSRKVTFSNKPVDLTLTELDIIRLLATNPGEMITRKQILEILHSSGKKKNNYRTIDVHIRSIRKKIPGIAKHLTAIYGRGYQYNP